MSIRDYVLDIYADLKQEIEEGKWIDAFVSDVYEKNDHYYVIASALKNNGKKTLLVYTSNYGEEFDASFFKNLRPTSC